MQSNTQNKVKIEYNQGKIFSKPLLSMSLSIFAYMWLLLMVFLVFGALLIFGNRIISIIINVAFLSICGYFFYFRGLYVGTRQAAASEIAFKDKLLGKNSSVNPDECFTRWRGFVAVVFGMLPFFLVALYFALHTERQYYQLGSLPSWLNQYMHYDNLDVALGYYMENTGLHAMDILRIFVRGSIMPFVSMANNAGAEVMLTVEKLSPLLILLVPSLYGFGYVQGENNRIQINKAIHSNAKRKNIVENHKKEKKLQKKKELI